MVVGLMMVVVVVEGVQEGVHTYSTFSSMVLVFGIVLLLFGVVLFLYQFST